MDYSKFHVTYVKILLSEMPVIQPYITPLLVHRTVGKVLAHTSLNYQFTTHIFLVWWFSLFMADLHLVAIWLFACSQPLVIAGYYYHHCLCDNQRWPCTNIGGGGGGLTQAGLLAEMNNCFRLFSLRIYLVSEACGHYYTLDSVHESIYISITTAGELLKV